MFDSDELSSNKLLLVPLNFHEMPLIFPKGIINHNSDPPPEQFRMFFKLPKYIIVETFKFVINIRHFFSYNIRKIIQTVGGFISGRFVT